MDVMPIGEDETLFAFKKGHVSLEDFARAVIDSPEMDMCEFEWSEDFGLVFHGYLKVRIEEYSPYGKCEIYYPCPTHHRGAFPVTLVETGTEFLFSESQLIDTWRAQTFLGYVWQIVTLHKPEMIDSHILKLEKWGWKKLGDLPGWNTCRICGKDKILDDISDQLDEDGERMCGDIVCIDCAKGL